MEEEIIGIIAEICGVSAEEIGPRMDLFDETGLDSFGVIQLVLALEETFSVSLEIEDIQREQIATPAKIAALIRERLL